MKNLPFISSVTDLTLSRTKICIFSSLITINNAGRMAFVEATYQKEVVWQR